MNLTHCDRVRLEHANQLYALADAPTDAPADALTDAPLVEALRAILREQNARVTTDHG